MSAACPRRTRTLALLERRASDEISRAEDRALKAHLAECETCREEALRADPTLLFASLSAAAEEVRPARKSRDAETEQMVGDVLAAIELERSRRRIEGPLAFRVPPRVLKAASIALLSAGLVGLVAVKLSVEKSERVASGRPPAVERLAARAAARRPAADPQQSAVVRPLVEEVGNPGATVYQFPASSPEEPTVVFVVDRNADI